MGEVEAEAFWKFLFRPLERGVGWVLSIVALTRQYHHQ